MHGYYRLIGYDVYTFVTVNGGLHNYITNFAIIIVDANTTITNGSHISVREGDSATISCISTGIPTPSISWVLDGQPAPFQSMEITIDIEGRNTLIRSDPSDPASPLIPESLSIITSNLLVVNAQYPDHDGVYVCTGSNDQSMVNISRAMINIQVVSKWI